MADYAPPPGPPPPRVPPGWKAVYEPKCTTYFYVNTFTRESTWEMPTEPAQPAGDAPPPGGPPSYDHGAQQYGSGYPQEKGVLGSNNPYASSGNMSAESDEAMARRLQAEEEARIGAGGAGSSDRGANVPFYGAQQGQPQYGQQQQYGQPSPSPYGQQLPPREESGKKGLFSKLSSKFGGSSSRPPQYGGGGYGGGYPQQGYGGGYPQQGYGGYPQQGYGGYPQQQGYGGSPMGGGMYGQPPPRRGGGGGMGMAGGAALGLGAGVLGGAMLANSMDDNDYQEGYEDGADAGGDDGGGE